MFVPFNLPISIGDIEPEKVLEFTKSDKKAIDKGIKFILLKRVGKAYIDQNVTDEDMIGGIREIYFSEEDEKE